MLELYPELATFAKYLLQTGSRHTVYFEQSGNPQGIPVLFLHGGPGSGCNEGHRRYFNPDQYRIILFDQRGCHRSKPEGLLEQNTTLDLLHDIEAIRQQLRLDQWVLFGGSWGATLALLYAEHYPQTVLGIILRGTFLARQCDFDWFAGCGVNRLFPDYWQTFIEHFEPAARGHLLATLHHEVTHGSSATQLAAAKAWSLYAGRIVTHSLVDDYVVDESDAEGLINTVKIEMHYAKNRYFIDENQILDQISNIADVPISIIHGRRDLTCLPEASWSLNQALAAQSKQTTLTFVANAGHLVVEPTMVDVLIKATDKMAAIIL